MKVVCAVCVAFFVDISFYLTYSSRVFSFAKSGLDHHPLHISPFKERENVQERGGEGHS